MTTHGRSSPFGQLVGASLVGIVSSAIVIIMSRQINADYDRDWQRIQQDHIAPQLLHVQSMKRKQDMSWQASLSNSAGRYATFTDLHTNTEIKVGDTFEAYRIGPASYFIPGLENPVPLPFIRFGYCLAPLGIAAGIFCYRRTNRLIREGWNPW
jgi:hypothetical protein